MDQQDRADISTNYLRFANEEARGRSALYDGLARGVAEDSKMIDFLLTLPREKRQPNLLLAASRYLFGTPAGWNQFRRGIIENTGAVRTIMLARSTQTNEPARCATLLPVLMQLPQPLALIEVGASAGLCLLPDLYAYDYGGQFVRPEPEKVEPPIFSCVVNAATPVPATVPRVVWRAGLDLNPLDVTDPDHTAWLEALVWPEQTDRLVKLRAAIEIAAATKPRLVKGDLRNDLARLAEEAPKNATLVIFHTAVLSYVSSETDRQNFAKSVSSLCQFWISNESPRVFPDIAKRLERQGQQGCFLLSVNGLPVAWTDPHGASLDLIGGSDTVHG
jgi:hypothetical protein